MKDEPQRWMEQAEAELKSARNNVKSRDYYVASLLAQQVAELALKAVLLHRGQGLIKIHNLVILGRKVDLSEDLIDKCDKLSVVYIETRYPDTGGEIPSKKFTQMMAEEDIKIADEVLTWSKSKISK